MIDGEFLRNISYVILAILVTSQILSFCSTARKINSFANVFSVDYDGFVFTLFKELSAKFPILAKLPIVGEFFIGNQELVEIETHTTNYAEHCNKHDAEPKFKEAKKVLEEHLDKLEDAINRSLITPLYLGLMGTIIGVIFGLWEYSIEVKANAGAASEAINYIIGSVRIAMFVTFWGLFLTVINSTIIFSKAKDKIEKGKVIYCNDTLRGQFPSDTEDGLAEIVDGMRRHLTGFNDKLGKNLDRMDVGFNAAIKSAESITQIDLHSLEKILNGIGGYVKNFRNMDKEFEAVNTYLIAIKELLKDILSFKFAIEGQQSLQTLTTELKDVAYNMKYTIDGNRKLLEDLNNIEYLKEIKQTSINVGRDIQENMRETEADITKKARDLNDNLETSFENIKESFDNFVKTKWEKTNANMIENFNITASELKNLGEFLNNFNDKLKESINTQVNSISKSFAESFEPVLEYVRNLKRNLSDTQLEEKAKEAIVAPQIERITTVMTKSFEAVYKSIEQWQDEITKNIKIDIEKRSQGNLETAIIALKDDLQEIKENSKPRSIFKIIRDLIGMNG